MPANTIVGFISQKGGVGKSTLTRAFACAAAQSGLSVKIADLDTQQGTCSNWYRRRLNNDLGSIGSVELYKTAQQALTAQGDFDLLILDGPARTSSATLEIAKASDLVVQPTGASIDDLEPAILVFHELVKNGIERSKLALALCRVGTDSEEAEARSYIQQAGYIVLDECLKERPAYRQAQDRGLSVIETNYGSLNDRAQNMIKSILSKIQ